MNRTGQPKESTRILTGTEVVAARGAMRTRCRALAMARLHIAGFSTEPTMYAVNLASAVPFACRGFADLSRWLCFALNEH